MSGQGPETKREAILDIAEGLGLEKFTPAEVEQIRRQLVAKLGASGKTSGDYIVQVLSAAGLRVVLSAETDTEGQYEEEFRDLLHFATLEEAEICLMRLDELWRKFRSEGKRAATERVLEVARLGRRRAEMIARNPRVEAHKRDQKQEILEWFRIWLETPDSFFDWLDLRKQSPEYVHRFGQDTSAVEE
jgi:hypothetical protein